MKINPILQETLELIRAAHLFGRNYKTSAPVSEDPHAVECAWLRFEEALIEALRKAIDELYEPRDQKREQFIKDEIARLERETWKDWNEKKAVAR